MTGPRRLLPPAVMLAIACVLGCSSDPAKAPTPLPKPHATASSVAVTSQPTATPPAGASAAPAASQDPLATAPGTPAPTPVMASPSPTPTPTPRPAVRVAIAPRELLPLVVGDTQAFGAALLDAAGSPAAGPAPTWTVDGAAAQVDASGLLTARQPGVATLRVAAGALADSLALQVVASLTTVGTVVGSQAGFTDGTDALLNGPQDVSADAHQHLYFTDGGNHTVRQVDLGATGRPVKTLAGDGTAGALDGPGGTARFNAPEGLAVDGAGNLWIADTGNRRVRKIDLSDPTHPVVSTVAGGARPTVTGAHPYDDGPGATASFCDPRALAFDARGNLLVGDGPFIRHLDLSSSAHAVSTFARNAAFGGRALVDPVNGSYSVQLVGLAVLPDGSVLASQLDTTNPAGGTLFKVAASGTSATALAGVGAGTADRPSLFSPWGLAADPAGGAWLASSGGNAIYHIGADGTITAFAGPAPVLATAQAPAAGHADGLAATASFSGPAGLALGPKGELYVADALDHRLRVITTRKGP